MAISSTPRAAGAAALVAVCALVLGGCGPKSSGVDAGGTEANQAAAAQAGTAAGNAAQKAKPPFDPSK